MVRKFGKKGITTPVLFLLVGIILFVLVGTVFYATGGVTGAVIADTAKPDKTITTSGEEVEVTATVLCDTDLKTDYDTRYEDILQRGSGVTYIQNIVSYAEPVTAGVNRVTGTNTTSTGSFSSTSNGLKCDEKNPVKYVPVSVTQQYGDGSNTYGYISDKQPMVVANGGSVEVSFVGKGQDRLKAQIQDNNAGATKDLNNSNDATLGFGSISGSVNYTTQDGAGITLGVGDGLDLKIRIKTNHTNKQFGEDDFGYTIAGAFKERTSDDEVLLPVVMAIDAAATDYDGTGPSISRTRGEVITLGAGDLLADDATALNGNEFYFATSVFDANEDQMAFVLDSKDSATNPSTDVTIRFCALARYNSYDLVDQTRVSCFDDGTSNSEIAFPTANSIVIDVN